MIPFQIEPAGTAGKTLLRVRCSDQQAIVLKRLLAGAFPGQALPLVPELDQTRFTHRCVVPEPEGSLRGRWDGWQIDLLLAPSSKPATVPHSPTTGIPKERPASTEAAAGKVPTEAGSAAPSRSP
ncbi:MAG: hypothetical protein ACRDGS_06790, partial [Chloroflexota bacterium]